MVEFRAMLRSIKSWRDSWNWLVAKENLSELGFLSLLIVAFFVALSLLSPLARFPASILKSPSTDSPAPQAGPSLGPCAISHLRIQGVHLVRSQGHFSNHNILDDRDSVA
jgi:hypothetical protein